MGWRAWIREQEDLLRKYKWVILSSAVVIVVVLLLSGTKLYLLLNFLLGNDIVVRLEANTTSVHARQGQTATVGFEASVITNPFCKATCNRTWKGPSGGTQRVAFNLTAGKPFRDRLTVRAPKEGHGQELYQYEMTCRSLPSTFCQTSGQPTKRSILISLEYSLSERQAEAKNRIQRLLPGLTSEYTTYLEKWNRTNTLLSTLRAYARVPRPDPPVEFPIREVRELWKREHYTELEQRLERFRQQLADADETLGRIHAENLLNEWNALVEAMDDAYAALAQFNGLLNETGAELLNKSIDEYHETLRLLRTDATVETKATLAESTRESALEIAGLVAEEERRTLVSIAVSTDIIDDMLCDLNFSCRPHENLTTRATTLPLRDEVCSRTLPVDNRTVSATARRIFQEKMNEYARRVPPDGPFSALLRSVLVNTTGQNTSGKTPEKTGSTGNVSREEVWSIVSPCVVHETRRPEYHNLVRISVKNTTTGTLPTLSLELTPPPGNCCTHKGCSACCETCQTDYLPVILLHGHAFNKDTLAEYSLDGFNKIQSQLEEHGILNAGTVSLYSRKEEKGLWGHTRLPVSVRASYYFDLFKEPENYIIVQTKSENIDTYAIRLKELIDTVLYRTGKRKVILVAHSMGGLVARRYVQVFGPDKVAGLVLIATPNKGITGDIADYCPLFGERLECRDMNKNSLFMNKLNRQELSVPTYNILGTGCRMAQGDGDGIVLRENALLDGAENTIIRGECRPLRPLHTAILDIDTYPDAYAAIQDAIDDISSASLSGASPSGRTGYHRSAASP